MIGLSVGFKTNLNVNTERKRDKYRQLIRDLSSEYHDVRFINLSLSVLGIFGNSCDPFIDVFKELDFVKQHLNFMMRKLTAIIISTYYLFCMRNKSWTNPDMLIYQLLSINLHTKLIFFY